LPIFASDGSRTSPHTHAVENDVKNIRQSGVHDRAPSFFFRITKLPLYAKHTELLCKQQLSLFQQTDGTTTTNKSTIFMNHI